MEQLFQKFSDEFNIKPDGKVNSSIRGVARLCDVESSSLSRALNSADAQSPSLLSQFLAECGFKGDAQKQWIKGGIPDTAISHILEYYAYECQERYRKQQAKQFSRAFRAIGIREWVHQQKNWKPQSQQTGNAYTKRLQFSQEKIKLPEDYWCIFDECSKLMGFLERHFKIDQLDLIDGSVGKRWANYRNHRILQGDDWPKERLRYLHPFPDQRKSQKSWAYHIDELKYFRKWYNRDYCNNYLWEYLRYKEYDYPMIEKLEAQRNHLILA